jgi:site-specific DNA-methyltransferase (adenine-specific)
MNLIKGDCLEVMKSIPDASVDAILTDPPYGTTACKWDSVIDFDLMWKQLNRIIKSNGAIVLFGSEPFSSALRMSNINNYKYDWIWIKNKGGNFFNAKKMPLIEHEIISVFYNKLPTYNPQMQKRTKMSLARVKSSAIIGGSVKEGSVYGNSIKTKKKYQELRNPSSYQEFNVERGKHPTQKPVSLMEYLILTYTNENETVLDFTMGSGSTGVACVNTKRYFIGIELDNKYFEIAKKRIEQHKQQLRLY